ncbi:MAG: phytanoyl-CoA dioxygenase family protein [Fimbriimonadaceae bacterium]|nr:phytanoyl-CoA dioxygenase family protein [Fimbriimonadaceae bacterium]
MPHDAPVSIVPTSEERTNGRLGESHLAEAVEAVFEDGCVLLKGVVAVDHVLALRERMMADLTRILSRPDTPFQFNRGNVQQDPPPIEEFLFADVLLNEYVIQVTHGVLGDGVANDFYSGNTALPGGHEAQPVHGDIVHLWPGLEPATPPFSLVVNLPLVHTSAHNGSTELWLGSHKINRYGLDGDIKVPAEELEARRAVRPPIQPTIEVGDMLIRDMRMWHGGTPNHSDQPRPMVAMIHWIHWWNKGAIRMPKGTESFFEHPVLRTCCEFTDGPVDYLANHGVYDLQAS